ncbi:MAG TPA: TIR domain-containing protein, partial [Methylomirabilota bacterium]|nr:TIR domain-containing protein [Methylomirabilota bacterium]
MAIKIFFCYSHEDELLLTSLKMHLRPLQREGLIDEWHDRDISAGTEWKREIDNDLNTAQVILLLISQYFMNSDYAYSMETKRALERHERGETRVIPVILRPVYWERAPFAKLQALPTNAKAVKSWHDENTAFHEISKNIRKIVEELNIITTPLAALSQPQPVDSIQTPTPIPNTSVPWENAPAPEYAKLTPPSTPEHTNLVPLAQHGDFALLRTLKGHTDAVGSLAISPDGQAVVSASSDGTIKVWELSTGRLVRTLKGYTDAVRSLAISPDGQAVVSASSDGTIKVWELSTGELLHTLKGHTGAVRSLAISPDGQTVVTASSDDTMMIWELPTGHPLSLRENTSEIYAVAISPDG